jgi:choline dehydrogenase-like flavoprotein
MFHPYATVEGLFEEPLDGPRGPHKSIWSHEFYETDATRGFVRGFSYEMHRGRGPVSTAYTGMANGRIPWGHDHHRAARERIDRQCGIVAVCEDLPDPDNRVTLDEAKTDSNGIPGAKITYKLGENSRRMIEFGLARGEEVMRAAGAVETTRDPLLSYAGWHNLGTARMGKDPATSVVNEWGRAHDVRNLFIIDGSVFVTAGAANPTRTIQAIALYVADSIKTRLANLFD